MIRFGSSVKGKLFPEDIDELHIFGIDHEPEEELKGKKHIVRLGLKQLMDNELLFSAILHEGLWDGKRISEIIGLKPYVLYKVDSSNLSPNERVKFSQALRERGGILKDVDAIDLGRVFLIPVGKDSEFIEFLKNWKVRISFRKRIFTVE